MRPYAAARSMDRVGDVKNAMEKQPHEEAPLRVFEFRFVVLLRGEGAERDAPGTLWRGWIQRVPDISELGAAAVVDQVAFKGLDEIPRIVRSLMGDRA
jgi:hypothetical protein